jgi:hypothetical protein
MGEASGGQLVDGQMGQFVVVDLAEELGHKRSDPFTITRRTSFQSTLDDRGQAGSTWLPICHG